MTKFRSHAWFAVCSCLVVLSIAGCKSQGSKSEAPPAGTPPPAAGQQIEPPGDPDIEMGQNGWTINGNAAISGSGNTAGSAFFGTVKNLVVKLNTQIDPIGVSSFTIAFPGASLTGAGATGSPMTWTLGTTTLTACTDSCNAVTIPSGIMTPSTGNDATFTYIPVNSSTATTVPFSTVQKVRVFFQ